MPTTHNAISETGKLVRFYDKQARNTYVKAHKARHVPTISEYKAYYNKLKRVSNHVELEQLNLRGETNEQS
jgi:hypothetical protein